MVNKNLSKHCTKSAAIFGRRSSSSAEVEQVVKDIFEEFMSGIDKSKLGAA
jgi:hypothetical protein